MSFINPSFYQAKIIYRFQCSILFIFLALRVSAESSISFEQDSTIFFADNKIKPEIVEGNGEIVKCYLDEELGLEERPMENWGVNIDIKPKYVFAPQTKIGLCNVVKWAAGQDLKIRACGYRHTWNPVYPDDGQILISLLGLDYVNSNKASYIVHGATGAGEEFRTIEYIQGSVEPDKIFCKIGGAVTNDELRDFSVNHPDPYQGNYWSIPLNVILVENTFSGTISSICHGGG
ncbi:MAG TPA: hypothetical protein VGP47_06095, partial [Parachlamydiaceae bacterium]|nr:hypothetical protein [Parachlamydiaceae bacterium]